MQRLMKFAWIPFLLVAAAPAWGQIWVPVEPVALPRPIVVPPDSPTTSYRIGQLGIDARIRDQVAQVQVSQTFVNTGSRQMEVVFVFPLPHDAAIDGLTFMVDGQEYQGEIMAADEARQVYESYIRRNRDPALLEWMDHGMFRTSVFPVPPGAERQVTLRYSQVLRRDHTLTDFLFPMSTAQYTSQAVEKVNVRVSIESSQAITSVYSPTHQISIERPSEKQAVITYEATDQVPTNDFRLLYDVSQQSLSASVISYRPADEEEGFFLLLASPQLQPAERGRPPKTVVLVVDRSGSMSGEKIEQAREALKFVLNNLREGDLFNIVAYDDHIESFAPELQRFDEETRARAIGFANSLYAGGGTNIDAALTTALEMLKDDQRPSYVVFLTDGLPTAGETNEMQIVANTQSHNQVRARLLSLGVGYDVSSRLLERLTAANFGQGEYVRPDENIEAHVAQVFSRISSPVLSGVEVTFQFDGVAVEDGLPVSRLYPQQVYDLFEGQQLVLAGRYRASGDAEVTIRGTVDGQVQSFVFPVTFVEKSSDESYGFVARLWAMRRIGAIVDEIDLNGRSDELVDELVQLSTSYGILTPYTSYLADDQPHAGPVADLRRGRELADEGLERLMEVDGRAGFAQRAENNALQFGAAPAAAAQGGFGGQAAGAAEVLDADADAYRKADDTVQTAGNESLYRRGEVWIAGNAADVDLEEDADQIEVIERFSDEYFQLVADNSAAENAVLARQQAGEELVIRLRGQVYRIQ